MNKEISNHYGEGGRLKKAADPLLVNTAYKHDCEDGQILMPYLTDANLAHLLVLQKGNIIPINEGKQIATELRKIKTTDESQFVVNPMHGDIYNNYDLLLTNKIGKVTGWLHAGRPRREAVNIAFLLGLRERYLEFIETSNKLLKAFRCISASHVNTIMPDFTYLHHAQPTTLGHYILTFAFPLVRDIARMKMTYRRINSSTGESGSVNGSRLNIDKPYFANLLGFQNYETHSRDAMWQPDKPLEVIYTLSSTSMNITRLAEELQIWNSREFNYVELPDSLCRASVIMPQKKNPYPLTYFRGLCNTIMSKMSAYGAYGRIFSGNPDSRIFIYGDLLSTTEKLSDALKLFTKVLLNLKFNEARLLSVIKISNAYATDIADLLILTGKINYKEAHHIVGLIARKLTTKNKTISELNINLLNDVIYEVVGIKKLIDNDELQNMLDPNEIIKSRKSKGGASQKEVHKMLSELDEEINKSDDFILKQKKCINDGEKYLETELNKYYGK